MRWNKVLVVAPHADDETFGCGGTILKLRDASIPTHVAVIAIGSNEFDHKAGAVVTSEERYDELRKVLNFYQVQGCVFDHTRELDSRLDSIPLRDIIQWLEGVQRRLQADTWLIPGPSFHQDHVVVFNAAIAAGRPFTSFAPKNILSYELPTYSYGPKHLSFNPTFFVDITDYLDGKLRAVRKFQSQLRSGGNPLSISKIRDWATTRGGQAGLEVAEAFEVVKSVW